MTTSVINSTRRFRAWLAKQTHRSDIVGGVARLAAAGKVRFSAADDVLTREALTTARIEWRKHERRQRVAGDVPAGALCGGCGHPASVHDDTDSGENSGACATPSCLCPCFTDPDGTVPGGADPADEESSRALSGSERERFRRYLARQADRLDAVGVAARAVKRGDVQNDPTIRRGLAAAKLEWRAEEARAKRLAKPAKSKANLITKPLPAGSVAARRRQAAKCEGCGKPVDSYARTVRVREKRSGVVRSATWHIECRDRARFGDDAVRVTGDRQPAGMRRTTGG